MTSGQQESALLASVYAGDDNGAFDELYRRHRDAVCAYARSISDRHRADDFTAEAFVRLWRKIVAGHGPTDHVRAYLRTTVRNLMVDDIRATSKHLWTADLASLLAGVDAVDHDVVDRIAVRDAYRSLPSRWQLLLRLTVIEDRSHADIGTELGLCPNAIAAGAKRARDGLRRAYVSMTDDWPVADRG